MNSLFCDKCYNLLNYTIDDNNLKFLCNSCYSIYDPNPTDTLIYEKVKEKNTVIFENLSNTAGKDPVNIKVYKKCNNCNNNISKQIRIGNEMTLINICTKCYSIFQ